MDLLCWFIHRMNIFPYFYKSVLINMMLWSLIRNEASIVHICKNKSFGWFTVSYTYVTVVPYHPLRYHPTFHKQKTLSKLISLSGYLRIIGIASHTALSECLVHRRRPSIVSYSEVSVWAQLTVYWYYTIGIKYEIHNIIFIYDNVLMQTIICLLILT